MRSVKKIVSIVLVLALCFLIGGCSKKPPKKQQVIKIPRPSQGEENTNPDDNTENIDDAYISDRPLAEKVDALSGEVEPEYKTTTANFKVTSDYTVQIIVFFMIMPPPCVRLLLRFCL